MVGSKSLVGDFDLDASLYREALEAVPGMYLELDGEGILRSGLASVTIWAAGDDFERFEDALERDSSVEAVTAVDTDIDGWRLYRTRVPEEEVLHYERTELGIVLLDASATHDGWHVRLRFPDRETLIEYRDSCNARQYHTSLKRLDHSMTAPATNTVLTPAQREILTAAHEAGYFDVPRRIMVEELAQRFDISDQAASERVRRGMKNLLANYVGTETGPVHR